MNQLTIKAPTLINNGPVNLPLSKSIANRMLIIGYLSGNEDSVQIPECDDSLTMKELLRKLRRNSYAAQFLSSEMNFHDNSFNTDDAGTVFRFMSALLAITPGTALLTGSARMLERPCGPLIDALVSLGAKCTYKGKLGYPPVLFEGRKLQGGSVFINASVSSQFISALMMIAPLMPKGLKIQLKGNAVSQPYIHLTAELMRINGINVSVEETTVTIEPGTYKFAEGIREADWSAASYWYTLAALLPAGSLHKLPIVLKGLKSESLQGDHHVAEIFRQLGVESVWLNGDLLLTRAGSPNNKIDVNLNGQPDLAPALAVACAGMQVEATIRGLETLVIKESNRLESIKSELKKRGYVCTIESNNTLHIHKGMIAPTGNVIDTYNDHRIAMAISMLSLTSGPLIINDPDVVNKSYPEFWNHLMAAGFSVH